jgi:hypothetical protein
MIPASSMMSTLEGKLGIGTSQLDYRSSAACSAMGDPHDTIAPLFGEGCCFRSRNFSAEERRDK